MKLYTIKFIPFIEEIIIMISTRHSSDQSINRTLFESLRKQR